MQDPCLLTPPLESLGQKERKVARSLAALNRSLKKWFPHRNWLLPHNKRTFIFPPSARRAHELLSSPSQLSRAEIPFLLALKGLLTF